MQRCIGVTVNAVYAARWARAPPAALYGWHFCYLGTSRWLRGSEPMIFKFCVFVNLMCAFHAHHWYILALPHSGKAVPKRLPLAFSGFVCVRVDVCGMYAFCMLVCSCQASQIGVG